MSHERLLRLGLFAVAPFVAAAPAHAATTVSRPGGDVRVSAAAGQANRIVVRRVGQLHIVTDFGDTVAAAPGSGCVAVGPNTVHCPALPNDGVMVASLDLDDTITAGGVIYGHYDGGSGADTINADATTLAARLDGGPGDDSLWGGQAGDVLDGGPGADVIHGGGGRDRADYSARSAGVKVTIDGVADDGEVGEQDNVTAATEDITGGSGNDSLSGNAGSNILRGLGGNDSLYGREGDDVFIGGDGDDRQLGHDGNDRFLSEAGADGRDRIAGHGGLDHVDYSARTTAVSVDLDSLADDGAPGEGDLIWGDIETLSGGAGADRLTGNGAANRLFGGAGDDALVGLAGPDILDGGAGFDSCRRPTRHQDRM